MEKAFCRHCGLQVHTEDWLNKLVLCDSPGQKHKCPAKALPGVKGKRTEGTLLKNPVKRIKRKSAFLKKLETMQKASANLDATAHCPVHKQFDWDCIECGGALESNPNIAVLRNFRRRQ